jgi:uncharacterized protein (DUF305 family)
MYRSFFIMIGLSAVAMFLAMYAMIASWADFIFNLNMVYMTGLMAAPMAVIMLLFMLHMYKDKRMNAIIVVVSALILIGSFLGIRTQTPIGDAELPRAMIPHHSGAILMCEQSKLSDPDVVNLCKTIVEAQKAEIIEMQGLLARH